MRDKDINGLMGFDHAAPPVSPPNSCPGLGAGVDVGLHVRHGHSFCPSLSAAPPGPGGFTRLTIVRSPVAGITARRAIRDIFQRTERGSAITSNRPLHPSEVEQPLAQRGR